MLLPQFNLRFFFKLAFFQVYLQLILDQFGSLFRLSAAASRFSILGHFVIFHFYLHSIFDPVFPLKFFHLRSLQVNFRFFVNLAFSGFFCIQYLVFFCGRHKSISDYFFLVWFRPVISTFCFPIFFWLATAASRISHLILCGENIVTMS